MTAKKSVFGTMEIKILWHSLDDNRDISLGNARERG